MVLRVSDVVWLALEQQDARAWSKLLPLLIDSIWKTRYVVAVDSGNRAEKTHKTLNTLDYVSGFKPLPISQL